MKRLLSYFASALLVLSTGVEGRDVVIGYVPTWRDKVVDPATFNFDILTHLNRAFLRPNDDGTLKIEDNYFNPAFEQAARQHGVKLLMSVGGEAKNPDRWLALAREPAHVQKFLDTLDELFRDHQYDGVDIDWEPPPRSPEEGQVYLALLKSIRQRFPGKLLTVALSPKNYAVKYLPLPEVMATIDYFNAMAYDFSGPWTGTATFSSNLNVNDAAHTQTSTAELIANLINTHNVPPGKLVVGMTFWAYRFRVDHLGDSFPKRVKGMADFIDYGQVEDLQTTGRYTLHRDDVADAAYLTRNDGGCVITFDDPQSIRDKTAFAQKMGCAGVMMWNAGADTSAGATPLLDAIAKQFDRPTMTPQMASNEDARRTRGIAIDNEWVAAPPTTAPATQP